jgi:FlaA1/EpsC-like NDP-sugar epimerase
MGVDNKIFIFDMGESVKIADMARRMIELAGYVPDKDIRIEYTGLRPGEKLYEEVLATSENTIPTEHQSIRVAKVREYDYFHVAQKLDQLCQMCREMDESNMVRLMKHVVPEFKSQNSKFEKYDLEIEEEIMRHPNPLKPARQKGKIFISSSKHA